MNMKTHLAWVAMALALGPAAGGGVRQTKAPSHAPTPLPTFSLEPTISPLPTSDPTVTPMPSPRPTHTVAPSITAAPSVTPKPSSFPTLTAAPSVTHVPTGTFRPTSGAARLWELEEPGSAMEQLMQAAMMGAVIAAIGLFLGLGDIKQENDRHKKKLKKVRPAGHHFFREHALHPHETFENFHRGSISLLPFIFLVEGAKKEKSCLCPCVPPPPRLTAPSPPWTVGLDSGLQRRARGVAQAPGSSGDAR